MEQIKPEEIETPKWFLAVHVVSRVLFLVTGAFFATAIAFSLSGNKEINIGLPFTLLILFALTGVGNTVFGFKKGWLVKRKA